MNRKKIFIIRAGALGDTLMLMPVISALRKDYEITVLGRHPGIDYLDLYADACIDMERGGWHRLFSREADIAGFSSCQFEHVFAFINDRENIVSENLYRLFPDSKIDILPPFPGPASKTHIAVYMMGGLRAAGLPVDPAESFDSAFSKPLMELDKGDKSLIVLHPGSGSKTKNYSHEFWFKLLQHIKDDADHGRDICLLLGPAEEEIIQVIGEKAKELRAEIFICPHKDELLSILRNTHLYIGHDSGVTHLAAMLGVKTIALFKDSSIDQWRPLGPFASIIESERDAGRLLSKVLDRYRYFMT